MTRAYYNEWDPYAAAWLRNLITAGLVAAGDVDERSIADVTAGDLAGYTQVHFFAGIGGWSYALRLAGWPDSRPVWTGSCPCQPFSCAGKGKGTADERHLWPEMFRLIKECRPVRVLGEQVESAVKHGWLDGVFADLEAEDYTCGAVVLGAHSVGAPHIRQRLWWLADAQHAIGRPQCGPGEDEQHGHDARREEAHGQPGARGEVRGLADSAGSGSCGGGKDGFGLASVLPRESGESSGGLVHAPGDGREQRRAGSGGGSVAGGRGACGMGDADGGRLEQDHATVTAGPPKAGFWSNSVPIPCGDGKARRLEPGIAPLAHGLPARVVRLRGYGNAINPYVAAEFVQACEEVLTR